MTDEQVCIANEFYPVDLGASIGPSLSRRLHRKLEELGWSSHLKTDIWSDIMPETHTIWKRDQIWLYLPQSGFSVFCVQAPATSTASALLARIDRARNISIPGPFLDGAYETLKALVEIVERRSPLIRPRVDDDRVFRYSKTWFHLACDPAASKSGNKEVVALLNPREVGCATSSNNPPSPTELYNHISQMTLTESSFTSAVQGSAWQYDCSWSTSTSWGEFAEDLQTYVRAAEFRVQSAWLAAYDLSVAAWKELDARRASSATSIDELASALTTMSAISQRRIGANSPAVPTRILERLNETSELQKQFESAQTELQTASALANRLEIKRLRTARGALEIFGFIFASSALAQLILPLPITLEVARTNIAGFSVWGCLTVLGLVIILRVRR